MISKTMMMDVVDHARFAAHRRNYGGWNSCSRYYSRHHFDFQGRSENRSWLVGLVVEYNSRVLVVYCYFITSCFCEYYFCCLSIAG